MPVPAASLPSRDMRIDSRSLLASSDFGFRTRGWSSSDDSSSGAPIFGLRCSTSWSAGVSAIPFEYDRCTADDASPLGGVDSVATWFRKRSVSGS